MLENIFEWDGATQHEIVFIFTAAFADKAVYHIPEQTILDGQGMTRVLWRMRGATSPSLCPAGFADMAAPGGAS